MRARVTFGLSGGLGGRGSVAGAGSGSVSHVPSLVFPGKERENRVSRGIASGGARKPRMPTSAILRDDRGLGSVSRARHRRGQSVRGLTQ